MTNLSCLRQELIDAFVESRYVMFIKYAAVQLQQLGLRKQMDIFKDKPEAGAAAALALEQQKSDAVGLATTLKFFLFPLCKKSLICLEGKSMTPQRGNTFSSVPPSNSLVSVSDL